MEAIGGGSSLSKKLTSESEGQLREAIFLVLSRWSALQLAIQNEWAGPSSNLIADQLVSDIFSWFTCSKEPLYIDDLENILDEGMLSLNVMIEDGSIEEVAEKLMILHEECLEGNYSGIEELRQTRTGTEVHQHIRMIGGDDEEEEEHDDKENVSARDDGSNMMVDAPEHAPEQQSRTTLVNLPVDKPKAKEAQSDEGWMVVSSRRNKGKRK
ncbi:hypothetical protein K2173_011684 [Erythroxylum novogranatense]|uniref:Pre-rRNA-processing protein TSR2 homolog n=1 Tax=Erythroxylum novogranatense TaxID=1862640 RepID=A0AAV8T0K0_9ROSI|nr:hypothetical protein K2173_011684 [Erythroxylum novogranatense]